MQKKALLFLLLLLLLTGMAGCRQTSESSRGNHIVVAISADLDHLNPLLIQLSLAREVCTLIYPSLTKPVYNEADGTITYAPSAAKNWKLSEDGKHMRFHLRTDVRWEDGKPLTSHDFKFSYRLYKNPKTASSRQHYLNDLLLMADGTADIDRGVETPDDSTLVLHFNKPLSEEIVLDHFNDLMPVAKHIFSTIPTDEIRSKAAELPVIGTGPFRVKEWHRQEKLVLESNPSSVLPHPAVTKTMSFLVVPEYTTRLAMLKSGQIDALISAGGISPKDAVELQSTNPGIAIKPLRNRYFDSVVWLNIDGAEYRKSKRIIPNRLFGERNVRQALTYAIDRESIIDGFMGPDHAVVVNTSLSPAYKTITNQTMERYAYNPEKARKLLREAGWTPGPDGILQKNGLRFSFELAAPVGNPRRNYAATIIQQNLREIGIDCRLRFDENLVFLKNQNEFRYDAALSGLAAETLPFQLIIWDSDFANRTFNSSAFRNSELDRVIAELSAPVENSRKILLWKTYQQILNDEQPRTFLYYYDELEGFSERLENVQINLLSSLYNAYDWRLRK